MPKGNIVADYYIRCGLCQYIGYADGRTKREAMNTARKAGWRYTNCYGWTCPSCLKRRGKPQE